jgi:hypothetical protein
MKYTKTHVHNPQKNSLGWAGLDLNELENFFPNLSSNFEKCSPETIGFLGSNSAEIASQSI